MTVTEKRRRGRAGKADEVLGPEHGSTLMELLDPPWDTIATKDDVAALGAEMDIRFVALEGRLDVRFAQVEARLAQLEATMEKSIRTSIFAAMGVQTAVIGLLLAIA